MTKAEKKKIYTEARKAVQQAWEKEFERAAKELQTRDWTDEEFELLKNKKKVPGYEGHHMKSVMTYPEQAGNPENIQFLRQERTTGMLKNGDHFKAHDGNFRNPSNGYYDDKSGTKIPFEVGEIPSIRKYERNRHSEEKQAGTEEGVFFMSKNENKGGSTMGNIASGAQEGIGVLTEMAGLMESLGVNCGPLVEGLQAAQIATEGMSIAQAALNLVMSLNPIALIVIAITSLVASLIYLWNTNEDFKNALIAAWNAISEASSAVWDAIVLLFTETIPAALQNVMNFFIEFGDFLSGLWQSVGEFFSTCWDAIILFFTETLPAALETATNFFAELPEKIWEFLTQAIDKLSEWASGLISKAGEVLPGVIDSVVGFFSKLPDNMLSIGDDMVKGIFNGISNSIQWLREKLSGWVDSVIDYIKGLFGIHSPSALMRDEVGKNLALGVAEGITKNKDAVSDAMAEMADAVTDTDLRIEPEVTAKTIDFETFKEKIRPSLDLIKSEIAQAQNAMTAHFSAFAQLATAKTTSSMESIYNKTTNFNNNYNITAANNSPKATADAIKNQMTMQRMLFAMR